MRARDVPAPKTGLRILTPEDVSIDLTRAAWHTRVIAFSIDIVLLFVLIGAAILVINIIASANASAPSDASDDPDTAAQLVASLQRLVLFVFSTFYFILFELKWHGQTPGKRLMRLRVVMRDGGPLDTGALVMRNLTRDLETLIPLVAILNPESLGLESGPRIVLFWVWLLGLAALPLLNPRHLRLGDLIGRTMVVALPETLLLANLTAAPCDVPDPTAQRDGPNFTPAQLAFYGAHELQVLEGLLRFHGDPRVLDGTSLLRSVAERIARRIDWTPSATGTDTPTDETTQRFPDDASARIFLDAFYRAQRAHLEGRLLLGERR